jgi:hypothetical protein
VSEGHVKKVAALHNLSGTAVDWEADLVRYLSSSITTGLRELVEEACFVYAQTHFPQLLARNGWDCPEAVELTEWSKLLPKANIL